MRRGAFDYLLKPCPVNEIVETVKRGLENRRRTRYQERLVDLLKETLAQVQAGEDAAPVAPEHPAAPSATGPITLDTQWRAAIVNGELIKLSNTEYNLLAHFVRHLNQVISCRELVWHTRGLDLSEREARPIIRMHIHRLRQKLEPNPSQPRFLRTVRGVGYMLVNDDKA
jgi:DNA-binding response OmpR family regulator